MEALALQQFIALNSVSPPPLALTHPKLHRLICQERELLNSTLSRVLETNQSRTGQPGLLLNALSSVRAWWFLFSFFFFLWPS